MSFINSIILTGCGVFLLLIPATPTKAALANLQEMIDMAGSQRMLTQRMLRDYALVGLKVTYKDPAQDLDHTVQRFDRQLQQLQNKSVNDAVSAAFVAVEELWQQIQPEVSQKPDKNKVSALRNDLEQLLKASHEAVMQLQEASGKIGAVVVNKSGRQRMLSQRMAALYMLNFWDITDGNFFVYFRQIVEEFRQAHNYLFISEKTTPAIRKKLKDAAKLFRLFEKAAAKRSNSLTPEMIQRNSDLLLKKMDEITKDYAAE